MILLILICYFYEQTGYQMFNLLMIILLITICQGRSSVNIADACKFALICNCGFTAVKSARVKGMR